MLLRVTAVLATLVVVAIMTVVAMRTTLIELAVRRSLSAAQLVVDDLQVSAIELDHALLSATMRYGPTSIELRDLRLEYRPSALLNRVVDRVVIDSIDFRTELSADAAPATGPTLDPRTALPVRLDELVVKRGSFTIATPQRVITGSVSGRLSARDDGSVDGSLQVRGDTPELALVGAFEHLRWAPGELRGVFDLRAGRLSLPELALDGTGGGARFRVSGTTLVSLDADVCFASLTHDALCLMNTCVSTGYAEGRWLLHGSDDNELGSARIALGAVIDLRSEHPTADVDLLLDTPALSDDSRSTINLFGRATLPSGSAFGDAELDATVGIVARGARYERLIEPIDGEMLIDAAVRPQSIELSSAVPARIAAATVAREIWDQLGVSDAMAASLARGPVRLTIDSGLRATIDRGEAGVVRIRAPAELVAGTRRGRTRAQAKAGVDVVVDRDGRLESVDLTDLDVDFHDAGARLQCRGRLAIGAGDDPPTVDGDLRAHVQLPAVATEPALLSTIDAELQVGLSGTTDRLLARVTRPGQIRIDAIESPDARLTAPLTMQVDRGQATLFSSPRGPSVTFALAGSSDAIAFEADRTNAAPTSFAGRPGSLSIDGTWFDTDVTAVVEVDGGTLRIDDQLAAEGIKARITTPPLAATFSATRLRDLTTPPRVAPLGIQGTLRDDGDAYRITGHGGWNPFDTERVTLIAHHRAATGEGQMTLELRPTTLTATGAQPGSMFPALADIRATAGTVSASAAITWTADDLKSSATLRLDDASLATTSATIEGLTLALELPSLDPLASAPGQVVTARSIDIGLPLTDLTSTFSIAEKDTIHVHVDQASVGFAKGRVGLEDTTLDLGASAHRMNLLLTELDLSDLLERTAVEGLSGTGKLTGIVPVVVDDAGMTLEDGRLETIAPGVLRYQSTKGKELLAPGGESVTLMLQALEDFRYNELTMTLRRDRSGDTRIVLSTLGKNPSLLEGHPFRINIDLAGNTESILSALSRAYRIRRGLEQEWIMKMAR